ncbi:MAG: PAS domain S-box protein [Verrucomicrobia bacterium]|nr:PAS domain S-box protein [Verrucomicrobiota bacterium]
MDGWNWIIGVALAGSIFWFVAEVLRPLRQLQRLISDLAEGKKPAGFVARGKWGLRKSIIHLEQVAKQLEGISSLEEEKRFSLQAILGSLNEGVLVGDLDGKITLANQEFLQMFGLDGIPRGWTVMEATRLVELNRVVGEVNRGAAACSLEVQIPGIESGASRTLAVNLAPILEGNQERSGVVMVFHDLSKIRRLEMVRQEFVTNLSHELRTPLSILAGYLETIEDPGMLKGAEGKKILEVMRRNCERLSLLVSDLLELSRIESGQLELKLRAHPPKEILREVKEDWSRAFSGKKVRIKIQCEDDLPVVQADPLRVSQIFSNLMENALRFAPSGSEVILGARPGALSGRVEFFVQDEGEGIPSDKVDRIFERFFRGDASRVREKGGTGLGLAIVKHLVQLHGGEVRAESALEQGTRVSFTLLG